MVFFTAVSKEGGTENESSEEGATRFWRMTLRSVAVLASVYLVHHSRSQRTERGVLG